MESTPNTEPPSDSERLARAEESIRLLQHNGTLHARAAGSIHRELHAIEENLYDRLDGIDARTQSAARGIESIGAVVAGTCFALGMIGLALWIVDIRLGGLELSVDELQRVARARMS